MNAPSHPGQELGRQRARGQGDARDDQPNTHAGGGQVLATLPPIATASSGEISRPMTRGPLPTS
jgi:hypothetical protein